MSEIELLTQIESNTRTKPQMTMDFKMTTNRKRFFFDQSIMLDDGSYTLGLINFVTYNTIFNVTEKKNALLVSTDSDAATATWETITLDPGAYEIDQMNAEINRLLGRSTVGVPTNSFTLEPNEQTLHSIIKLNDLIVSFNTPNSIASILGFRETTILTADFNKSPNKVNIISVDRIHLCCDAIDGSLLNGKESPILFSFVLNEEPGTRIVREPNVILPKYLNKQKLETIEFWLIDDDGEPVSFQGETITFTTQILYV